MKKLIILLLLITGCTQEERYEGTGKYILCREILKQRSSDRYDNRMEALKLDDSLFLNCGCDTLTK